MFLAYNMSMLMIEGGIDDVTLAVETATSVLATAGNCPHGGASRGEADDAPNDTAGTLVRRKASLRGKQKRLPLGEPFLF
jgi:hypothetical protein